MCSWSPFSFTTADFHLGGRKHFPFSHRRYKIVMFLFQRNWSPCFLSLALALSLLSTLIWILKFSRKKTGLCCCFFLSKNPGGHAIYRRNARVLEMRKFLAGLHD